MQLLKTSSLLKTSHLVSLPFLPSMGAGKPVSNIWMRVKPQGMEEQQNRRNLGLWMSSRNKTSYKPRIIGLPLYHRERERNVNPD